MKQPKEKGGGGKNLLLVFGIKRRGVFKEKSIAVLFGRKG